MRPHKRTPYRITPFTGCLSTFRKDAHTTENEKPPDRPHTTSLSGANRKKHASQHRQVIPSHAPTRPIGVVLTQME